MILYTNELDEALVMMALDMIHVEVNSDEKHKFSSQVPFRIKIKFLL